MGIIEGRRKQKLSKWIYDIHAYSAANSIVHSRTTNIVIKDLSHFLSQGYVHYTCTSRNILYTFKIKIYRNIRQHLFGYVSIFCWLQVDNKAISFNSDAGHWIDHLCSFSMTILVYMFGIMLQKHSHLLRTAPDKLHRSVTQFCTFTCYTFISNLVCLLHDE